jgi:hypothetical protein
MLGLMWMLENRELASANDLEKMLGILDAASNLSDSRSLIRQERSLSRLLAADN